MCCENDVSLKLLYKGEVKWDVLNLNTEKVTPMMNESHRCSKCTAMTVTTVPKVYMES